MGELFVRIWTVADVRTIPDKKLHQILLLIPAVTLALNIVRLVIPADIAYKTTQEQAMAVHTILEGFLLPIGLIAIFMIGGKLRDGKSQLSL